MSVRQRGNRGRRPRKAHCSRRLRRFGRLGRRFGRLRGGVGRRGRRTLATVAAAPAPAACPLPRLRLLRAVLPGLRLELLRRRRTEIWIGQMDRRDRRLALALGGGLDGDDAVVGRLSLACGGRRRLLLAAPPTARSAARLALRLRLLLALGRLRPALRLGLGGGFGRLELDGLRLGFLGLRLLDFLFGGPPAALPRRRLASGLLSLGLG